MSNQKEENMDSHLKDKNIEVTGKTSSEAVTAKECVPTNATTTTKTTTTTSTSSTQQQKIIVPVKQTSGEENVSPSSNLRPDCDSKKDQVSSVEEKDTANDCSATATASSCSSNKRKNVPEQVAANAKDGNSSSFVKRSRTKEGAEGETLDLGATLGFKAGDRFEVEWEVTLPSTDDGGNIGTTATESKTRWWGGTLLEHDGRTVDSVAIRVLDYDPYPEGGFPDRSREDVVFLGNDSLVDLSTQLHLPFRPEGDESSPTVWMGRGDMEDFVNATLMEAMKKNAPAFNRLDRDRQGMIAELIAGKKEKLLKLLQAHEKTVITASDMKSILQQTIQDD